MQQISQRVPPREQVQLIGWLAQYFDAPPETFRKMTPEKRWTIYQRICDKVLYPTPEDEVAGTVYH